jgi:hypothetical protein
VYFHEPKWSSAGDSTTAAIGNWWDVMFKGTAEDELGHRVDLVLNGHEHYCERHAKMNESGVSASDGIRELIVGSGGKSVYKPGVLEDGQQVPVDIEADPGPDDNYVTLKNHGFEDGDTIHFAALTPAADTGLSTNTKYYVVQNRDADTFKLSLTPGGAEVNVTTDATDFLLVMDDGSDYTNGVRDTSEAASPKPEDLTGSDGLIDTWSKPTAGVLELELGVNSYRYRFVPATVPTGSGGANVNGNFEDPDPTPGVVDAVLSSL